MISLILILNRKVTKLGVKETTTNPMSGFQRLFFLAFENL